LDYGRTLLAWGLGDGEVLFPTRGLTWRRYSIYCVLLVLGLTWSIWREQLARLSAAN
jgi:hypothetical protein